MDGSQAAARPILFLDVDGVLSIFGFDSDTPLPAPFSWIDGIAHCIPPQSGALLEDLHRRFEIVWATGWEEKANEYLPQILGLSFSELPCLTFDGQAEFGSSHWKLGPIEEYAGDRPAAWIDDNLGDACRLWAHARQAPTLLVETTAWEGIGREHVDRLIDWADGLAQS